jgi:hypothetical protein
MYVFFLFHSIFCFLSSPSAIRFRFMLSYHICCLSALLYPLRVNASLPLAIIASIFPSLILASHRATKQGNIDIYISVTYFTLIIRDSLCIFAGPYKDTNVIIMGLLR